MKTHKSAGHDDAARAYILLAVNMVAGFAAMYLVMFSMIDGWRDFRNNLNMLYMALTMAAPMGVLMLLTMSGMYPKKRLNLALHAGFVVVFVAALAGTRLQTLIGDRQFIRSMIPHHSGAIQMCEEANLADRELIDLCREISAGQRREINQMEAILARLDR